MDLAEALAIAIERTGHQRYAELLDPAHPDFNPAYEAAVRAVAEGEWPPANAQPAVPEQPPAADTTLVVLCPDRGPASCCGRASCAAGRGDEDDGAISTLDNCRRCVAGETGPVPLAVALAEWARSVPVPDEGADRAALNAEFYFASRVPS